MQTRSKKPSAGPKATTVDRDENQIDRFKRMAQELGADESPDALDRAFGRLDAKKKDNRDSPSKAKAKGPVRSGSK